MLYIFGVSEFQFVCCTHILGFAACLWQGRMENWFITRVFFSPLKKKFSVFLVYCKREWEREREWTKWWLKDLQCYSTETSEHDSHIWKKIYQSFVTSWEGAQNTFPKLTFPFFSCKINFLFLLLSKQKYLTVTYWLEYKCIIQYFVHCHNTIHTLMMYKIGYTYSINKYIYMFCILFRKTKERFIFYILCCDSS